MGGLADAELAADRGETVERELQLVVRVRGGHDRPHARLVLRDGWKRNALREHALLEEPIRERHRQRPVADDHRRDRTLAGARIEAEIGQTFLEEARVLPEAIDDLRLLEE